MKYMVKHSGHTEKYENYILKDMIVIKKLGAGQYGCVYLVKNKGDGKTFALKVI
jgi:serine/threonine protein kinase